MLLGHKVRVEEKLSALVRSDLFLVDTGLQIHHPR